MSNQLPDFSPAFGLRSQHIQSILASAKIRVPLMKRRAREMYDASEDWIIDADEGVKLHSVYSKHGKAKSLIILIHGWEGSHESIYMQSAAGSLYNAGFDVLRLNMRDHGPSHHLNEGLFHAQRLDEMVRAIHYVKQKTDYAHYALVGFSLGGNFTLRIAQRLSELNAGLDNAVAVCPVFDPIETFAAMKNGLSIYTRYFVKKWKRSLNKKSDHYPELISKETIAPLDDLQVMTDLLVERFTPYDSSDDYFNSYALTEEGLQGIRFPVHVLIAEDDPVIPFHACTMVENDFLNFHVHKRGGHCGFIKNYRMDSYIDEALIRLFEGLR